MWTCRLRLTPLREGHIWARLSDRAARARPRPRGRSWSSDRVRRRAALLGGRAHKLEEVRRGVTVLGLAALIGRRGAEGSGERFRGSSRRLIGATGVGALERDGQRRPSHLPERSLAVSGAT